MQTDTIEVVEPDCILDKDWKINIRTGEAINIRDTKPLLYVSGPMYSEGMLPVNVHVAAFAAEEAYRRGWAPVVPHLDCLAQFITKNMFRPRYMDVDLALIRASTAVLLLPYTKERDANGNQTGTGEEVDFAEVCGIPIYTLETLPYVN